VPDPGERLTFIPRLAQRRAVLLRRVFTLSGVFPLGAFFVVHLAINARVLAGEGAFVRAANEVSRMPGLALFEALFIFAPLLFHAGFGLWLVAARRPLIEPSPYPPMVRVAVRVTGVLALAFLALHLPELRLRSPGARPGGAVLLSVLGADLSSLFYGVPWRGVAYLLGSGCVCFHFAAGLWAFFSGTRHGEPQRARRRAAWWAGAVGLTMWVLFVDVVVYHATGTRLFGGAAREDASSSPCPTSSSSAQP
jgi:succinate dehydrogenase / fumarate reductase cytochrome b subunit